MCPNISAGLLTSFYALQGVSLLLIIAWHTLQYITRFPPVAPVSPTIKNMHPRANFKSVHSTKWTHEDSDLFIYDKKSIFIEIWSAHKAVTGQITSKCVKKSSLKHVILMTDAQPSEKKVWKTQPNKKRNTTIEQLSPLTLCCHEGELEPVLSCQSKRSQVPSRADTHGDRQALVHTFAFMDGVRGEC